MQHGFLILDKPLGISSAKAVAEVKSLLRCPKIGHGGTLDPLASGVLPLAIGEATKAFDYVAASRKEYHFTVTFGEERSTGDGEGECTAQTDYIPSEKATLAALPEFTGTILQIPPTYSAIKIDGKRAYQRVRGGETPLMQARPIEIYSLKLLGTCKEGTANFAVTCGKGTYIRSLAQDIARRCGSLGYISALRRVSVGKFHENNAISLECLKKMVHVATLPKFWVPIELALDDILAINLEKTEAIALRQGKTLEKLLPDGNYIALFNRVPVAFVEVSQHSIRSKRVLNIIENF